MKTTLEYGNKLRVIRKNRGVTIEEMAKSVGIHRETLSNIERGKTFPRIDLFNNILHKLDFELDIVKIK